MHVARNANLWGEPKAYTAALIVTVVPPISCKQVCGEREREREKERERERERGGL